MRITFKGQGNLSTNLLPFYHMVWLVVKTCQNVSPITPSSGTMIAIVLWLRYAEWHKHLILGIKRP